MHAMLTEDRVELYVNALFSRQHDANVVRLSIRFTPKSKWRHVTLTLNEAAGIIMALSGELANFHADDEQETHVYPIRDTASQPEKLHPRQDQLLANAGVTDLPPPPLPQTIVAYDEPTLWDDEDDARDGGRAYQETYFERWPTPVFEVRPRRRVSGKAIHWVCDIVNTQRDDACAHTIMDYEWEAYPDLTEAYIPPLGGIGRR